MRPDEFQKLISELAEGSEMAARRLAEEYTPHVTQVVRSSMAARIRPKVDSADYVQSVWASILINRDRLAQFTEPEQLIRYLAVMARHKVFDGYRNLHTAKNNIRVERRLEKKREFSSWSNDSGENGHYPTSTEPSPSEFAIERELWERIGAVGSERDREVVAMRVQGASYKQIADQLGVSEKTVQRTLDKLLGALQ